MGGKIFNVMNMAVRFMTATWTFLKKICAAVMAEVTFNSQYMFSKGNIRKISSDNGMIGRNSILPVRVLATNMLTLFGLSKFYFVLKSKFSARKNLRPRTNWDPMFFEKVIYESATAFKKLSRFCLSFIVLYVLTLKSFFCNVMFFALCVYQMFGAQWDIQSMQLAPQGFVATPDRFGDFGDAHFLGDIQLAKRFVIMAA